MSNAFGGKDSRVCDSECRNEEIRRSVVLEYSNDSVGESFVKVTIFIINFVTQLSINKTKN